MEESRGVSRQGKSLWVLGGWIRLDARYVPRSADPSAMGYDIIRDVLIHLRPQMLGIGDVRRTFFTQTFPAVFSTIV